MGLLGQVLGKVTLVFWAGGEDSTGQTSYSCRGPLVKVMLSVAVSVSPEICLGCSVVNEISGPEANPPLLGPEQFCVVPGDWAGWWRWVGNWRLWGEEPCVGRALDSLIEWVGARDVLKLNVNPQPHYPPRIPISCGSSLPSPCQ